MRTQKNKRHQVNESEFPKKFRRAIKPAPFGKSKPSRRSEKRAPVHARRPKNAHNNNNNNKQTNTSVNKP